MKDWDDLRFVLKIMIFLVVLIYMAIPFALFFIGYGLTGQWMVGAALVIMWFIYLSIPKYHATHSPKNEAADPSIGDK